MHGKSGGNAFKTMLFDCFVPLPSALVKRDVYYTVGGINGELQVAEDYDLFLKVAKNGNVIYTNTILSAYRIHPENLSNREYWRIFEESIKVVSQHASTHRFFAKISSISWKGRYILATIRRTDWPRFLYLTVKPDYIFGLLFYVTLVRPCIYILRKSNKID